jgi:hypothetical protein
MNEKNVDFLKDQMKYLGFGESMGDQLTAAVKEGKPEFTIRFQGEFNQQPFEANLHFKKSNQSDMYFFNKYEARLPHEQDPSQDRQSTFHLNKGTGITAKEAFNLLNGRAVNKDLVNKEGQQYNAWVQLDLKNKDAIGQYPVNFYHERYGFDLEKALSSHPIKELKDGERRYIEAAPQFKSINQFDEQMRSVKNHMEKNAVKESLDQKKQKENSLEKEGSSEELSKNRQRKKGLSV